METISNLLPYLIPSIPAIVGAITAFVVGLRKSKGMPREEAEEVLTSFAEDIKAEMQKVREESQEGDRRLIKLMSSHIGFQERFDATLLSILQHTPTTNGHTVLNGNSEPLMKMIQDRLAEERQESVVSLEHELTK